MKRIYVSLTTKGSIDKAVKELQRYKETLVDKEKEFCRRIADIGVNAAMTTLATNGQGDSERSASFNIAYKVEGRVVEFILSITSTPQVTKDGRVFYPHLAWEFGAGNYYNGMKSPNPKAGELGMGPGTFPHQTHVPEPGVWYYRDDDGQLHRSVGTQATMPMHTAVVEMMNSVETIANEIYGGG